MKKNKNVDVVNAPSHYYLMPGVQVIEVIRASLTPEEFEGYCKGNSIKYQLRANKKHDKWQEDWLKSRKYLEFLFEARDDDDAV